MTKITSLTMLLLALLAGPASAQATEKWAPLVAASGPLADGLSTWWAMEQSGPHMRIRESNKLYTTLFGKNVKGHEIMALKTLQAWAAYHHAKNVSKKDSVSGWIVASLHVGLHAYPVQNNIRKGARARRINRAISLTIAHQW